MIELIGYLKNSRPFFYEIRVDGRPYSITTDSKKVDRTMDQLKRFGDEVKTRLVEVDMNALNQIITGTYEKVTGQRGTSLEVIKQQIQACLEENINWNDNSEVLNKLRMFERYYQSWVDYQKEEAADYHSIYG